MGRGMHATAGGQQEKPRLIWDELHLRGIKRPASRHEAREDFYESISFCCGRYLLRATDSRFLTGFSLTLSGSLTHGGSPLHQMKRAGETSWLDTSAPGTSRKLLQFEECQLSISFVPNRSHSLSNRICMIRWCSAYCIFSTGRRHDDKRFASFVMRCGHTRKRYTTPITAPYRR
jgi:hypothetical protein